MVSPNNSINSNNPTDPKINPTVKSDGPLRARKETNPRKNFKDVMEDNSSDEVEDVAIGETDPDGQKKSSLMSLIGQTANLKQKNAIPQESFSKENAPAPTQDELALNLPSATPSTLPSATPSTREKEESVADDSDNSKVNENNLKTTLKTEEKKGNVAAQFEQTAAPSISSLPVQGDLNPINLAVSGKVEQVAPVKSPIEDIVVELIDKLTIIQTKGQTDTVVTINAPGIFKGAIIVISEFDSAKGQLNLAFENLKNEAKTLLDSFSNRENLLQALSKGGYTVQGFITTTITEHKPLFREEEASGLGKSREEPEDEDNRNRRNQKNQ